MLTANKPVTVSELTIYSLVRGVPRHRASTNVKNDLGVLKITHASVFSNLVDKLTRLPETQYKGLMESISSLKRDYDISGAIHLRLPKIEKMLRTDYSGIPAKLLYDQYFDNDTNTLDIRLLLASKKKAA
ncbi:MAG: hypothetical protein WC624_00945 [Candidatus Margulisiibacteriota bacterium]